MELIAFTNEWIPAAAQLFRRDFNRQRQLTPALPDRMAEPGQVEARLQNMLGVAAVQDGRLLGYLCWFIVEQFRGANRRGAYCPEWGHACQDENLPRIYQGLYRAASERWEAGGCQVHAITLLAQDRAAERAWFWNGFGLTVVDGVRWVRPLEGTIRTPLIVRKAISEEGKLLSDLDAEHVLHYQRSPIFMTPRFGSSPQETAAFLASPRNSIWAAWDGDVPVGFIRFDGNEFDGASILEAEQGVCITGAYFRPNYRGQHAAAALLDAAMRDFSRQGLAYCAVNFESFNPEAASFWMKYFEPVCYSVLRVPEKDPQCIL